MFDLTANPSMKERRQLARERPVIAAEPDLLNGCFHGIFIPKQPVQDNATQLVAITCKHTHLLLEDALLCANMLGNELIVRGYGEIVDAS